MRYCTPFPLSPASRKWCATELGAGLRLVRKLRLERLTDPLVVLPPRGPEERLVGLVADQRVLEPVPGVRGLADLKDELALDQLGEPGAQPGLLIRRRRGDQRVRELAPDHGGEQRELLGGTEPVEAGHERVAQRCGGREGSRGGFQDRLGELLQVERHAFRPGDDLQHPLGRQAGSGRDVLDDAARLVLDQGVEADRELRLRGPSG